MTAGFLLTVVCSFVLVVAGRMLLHQLARMVPLPVHLIESVRGTGFWMMIALVFVFLMLFNKIVPNLHLGFREVWPGALSRLWHGARFVVLFVLCGQYGAVFRAVRLARDRNRCSCSGCILSA